MRAPTTPPTTAPPTSPVSPPAHAAEPATPRGRRRSPGRRRAVVAALGVLALLAPACDDVDEAVSTAQEAVEGATEAVGDTAQLVQFCASAAQVARAAEDRDVDAAVEHGESMVAHAPDDIEAQAQTMLMEARRAQGGDYEGLQSEEFQQAASEVVAYTQDRCDPR